MTQIEHFALFTDQLERLRDFYVEAFGLRVVLDNSRAPVPGYFLADGRGVVLEIIERPQEIPAVETRYACHVAFSVADLGAARARLEVFGCRFEAETAVETDSFKTAFFRDPAGNRCQIVWRQTPLVGD
ncbi:MAG: diguanylate cyclase [Isosphaeraceae bacterium]|jgi:glyoxylase I family protein|nr:MAG: diguanylate cyclase [Isosphaeraceae bacterium]